MRHDLTISKGNQYNRDGYYIEVAGSTRYAWGDIGEKMNGSIGITWDGDYRPQIEDYAAVESVIRQVLSDGVTRSLSVGDDEPVESPTTEWRSQRGLTLNQEMEREDTIY